MSTLTASESPRSWLTMLPIAQYRRSRSFYIKYDLTYFLVCLAALALMQLTPFVPLLPTYEWWFPLALPFVIYAHWIVSVFIHNASHGNFPRAINRIVGEICGVIVLSRFASWQIVHQRHHMYSDDRDRDPHPVDKNYWLYLWNTLVNVERQLQTQYFDVYGDTPESRRYEKIRAYISYATGVCLILAWWSLLGTAGFFFFFVPASILGIMFIVHFNWSTHGATIRENGEYEPVNLNHGIYRLGNKLFFGIYMHANHHKRAALFNPARWPAGDAQLPCTGKHP